MVWKLVAPSDLELSSSSRDSVTWKVVSSDNHVEIGKGSSKDGWQADIALDGLKWESI